MMARSSGMNSALLKNGMNSVLLSVAPGAEGAARGLLPPYFLAIAVQLDDDVAVSVGREGVAIGKACRVRGVRRGRLPDDFALPVDFDDLVRAVLGDEQI